MRWSLNEIVTESSRVQCELCCEDCQGDRTEFKQQRKSSEKKHDAQTSFACRRPTTDSTRSAPTQ